MENKDKRRTLTRNPTAALIVCQPFTSRWTTHTADGIMRNFSKEGSYIETSRDFKPGTILHLRVVHYPPMRQSLVAEERPQSTCLVEVKWRQELDRENTLQYGVGLRYLG